VYSTWRNRHTRGSGRQWSFISFRGRTDGTFLCGRTPHTIRREVVGEEPRAPWQAVSSYHQHVKALITHGLRGNGVYQTREIQNGRTTSSAGAHEGGSVGVILCLGGGRPNQRSSPSSGESTEVLQVQNCAGDRKGHHRNNGMTD